MTLGAAITRTLHAATASLEHWLLAPVDAQIYTIVRATYALASLAALGALFPYRLNVLGEAGIVPRIGAGSPLIPLHYVSSDAAITTACAIVAVAGIALVFGFLPRSSTFVLWLWSVSYGTIAYPIDGGYDAVLRTVGFVLLVSPTLRKRSPADGPRELPRYGLRLLQFQLSVIYVATLWFKAPDVHWRNGELMAYFMMSMFSRFPSAAWADWGRLSVLLTWSTLVLEALLPVLVWTRLRPIALCLGVVFHLSIGISSTIEMFSIAMLPLYASFLAPHEVAWARDAWQRLRARGSAQQQARSS